ncbi:MAG TPA: tRNA (guanosine(46)-N7)-methyltransferase TrmB [Stellaceae bacterium]
MISSKSYGARSEAGTVEPTPNRQRLYGRKRGRPLHAGQHLLTRELLPQLAIGLPVSGEIDLSRLFSAAPHAVWLEIGYGAGEHLAAQAEANPGIGLVGCEVFENGIAKMLGEISRRRLSNIRLYTSDARLLIEALPPASIGRVFVLFPDPWPKARHHKRRIVANATLDQLARIMVDDAELRLATDDRGYFAWMLERVIRHPGFEWTARRPADWRRRPADWPATRYEEKALAAGAVPLFLRARRKKHLTPAPGASKPREQM